jgi:pimeloyl-ACP methyl ester carboxylesterase
MDRSSSFARVAKHLDGYRVVRYDRRGYGRSLAVGPPASFDDQVADLLEVFDAEVTVPAVIFGHSYGGTIGLAVAQREPDRVAAVVAYECPLPWMPWWPGDSAGGRAVASREDPEAAGEAFMRRMVGDRRWERLPPSSREARRAEGPTLVAEIAQLRPPHPVPVDLAAVRVPVVAAHGTDGADYHHRAAETVAEEVPGARLVVVEGAGHGVHLTHPLEVARLVRGAAAT